MNFETMSKQRKMILIAAAVGVIAMFLPWISISILGFDGGSVNGMQNEGILVFLCFLGAGALALLGDQTKALAPSNWMLALIAGGLATLLMVIRFFNWLDALSFVSFGFYLAFAAAIGVLAFTYMHRSSGDTIQGGFDRLKSGFSSNAEPYRSGTTTTTTTVTPVSHTTTDDDNRQTI